MKHIIFQFGMRCIGFVWVTLGTKWLNKSIPEYYYYYLWCWGENVIVSVFTISSSLFYSLFTCYVPKTNDNKTTKERWDTIKLFDWITLIGNSIINSHSDVKVWIITASPKNNVYIATQVAAVMQKYSMVFVPPPPHHLLILVCCAFTTDLLPYFDLNLLEIHNLNLVVNLSVYFMTETIQPYKILLRNCLSTYIFFCIFFFTFRLLFAKEIGTLWILSVQY